MKILPFLFMLAVLIMPGSLFAQEDRPQTPAAQGGMQVQSAPEHPRSGRHMKDHDERMSKMKEMDARLDEKVAAMDAAKGDQKVEAMAAVIKEMVSQRKIMQEHMMKMREMRKGKDGHMQRGMKREAGKGM
jgi:hypothetical protein